MMKKKIAIAMAGAMIAPTVAPVLANADVVDYKTDINDAAALTSLRAELQGYFNTKYTEDTTLLKDTTKAGKCVYTITVDGRTITDLADFDAHVSSLAKDDTAKIIIKDKGFQEKDGEIVDCDTFTYKTLDADQDGKADLDGIISGSTKDGVVTINEVGQKLAQDISDIPADQFVTILNNGATANRSVVLKNSFSLTNLNIGKLTLVNVALNNVGTPSATNLDIQLTTESEVLDLTKPIIASVKTNAGHTVNVITGFETAKYALEAGSTLEKHITLENKTIESKTVSVSDLYSEGRLTLEGNRLVQALNKRATNSNDEFVKVSNNNNKYQVTKINHTGVKEDANDNLSNVSSMYKYDITKIEDIAFKDSMVKITIKGDEGYKYKKGMAVNSQDPVLFELTVKGTRDEINAFYANVMGRSITASGQNDLKAVAPNPEVKLLAHEDRYTTAVEVSKNWSNSKDIVLVSGEVVADGLAATPFAASLNRDPQNNPQGAPILLTANKSLPMEVKREIIRLQPERIFVVGGQISDEVHKELGKIEINGKHLEIQTIAGDDRFDTSLQIAKKMDEMHLASGANGDVNKVYITGGYAEADTLSISALAGQQKTPIILTPKAGLTHEQVKFLKNENLDIDGTVIVGGTNSVEGTVETQLKAMDVEADRLKGNDRQHTNALVIEKYNMMNEREREVLDLHVVKSDEKGFVDALAAGALASKNRHNILVIATEDLSAEQKLALDKLEKNSNNRIPGYTNNDPKKVDAENKIQIGYGISDKVIKAINTLVEKYK